MFWIIFIFLISCFVLLRAGTRAVKALSRIAHVLGLSEFTVAFVLMALASSLPELFVAITSAFQNKVELAFGNIIGANIIDLTLALALPILVSGAIITKRKAFQKNALLTATIALLPVILLLDGALTRVDGLILLLSSLLFLSNLLKQKEQHSKVFEGVFNKIKHPLAVEGFVKEFFSFLLAVALLVLAAEGIVWSAGGLAMASRLPLLFIGAILVALGTTLPELVFGLKAAKTEHNQMTAGTLMGAVVVHNSLILGLMFLIRPLIITNPKPYISGIIFSVIVPILFFVFVKTDKNISKKEAFVLLLVYLLFASVQLFTL
ncbi:hypothetical protein L6252_00805 [Candidatus Parcubacteria bacterium]|nr:hypothetical protein [Candidatus Parcubacteria bacterium]